MHFRKLKNMSVSESAQQNTNAKKKKNVEHTDMCDRRMLIE